MSAQSAAPALPAGVWNALLDAGRDHLGDVAPAQRDAFPRESQSPFLRPDLLGQASNSSARATSGARSKPNAISIAPPCPLRAKALAVRAIAANDEAGSRPAPPDAAATSPAAMPCARSAELLIRREDDQPFSRSASSRDGNSAARRARRARVRKRRRAALAAQIARNTLPFVHDLFGGRVFAIA